jgi:hypothetical protein
METESGKSCMDSSGFLRAMPDMGFSTFWTIDQGVLVNTLVIPT